MSFLPSISGTGLGIALLPSFVTVQQHFSQNRVTATGLSLMGFSTGAISGPYITEELLEFYGWRGTLLILAGLTMHTIPLGLTFWSPAGPQETTAQKNSYSEGHSIYSTLNAFIKKALDFSLLKNHTFLVFCFAFMLQKFCLYSFTSHFPSFGVYEGYSLAQAAFLTSVISFSNTAFRFMVAFIANIKWISSLIVYTIGMAVFCISIISLICFGGYARLVVSAITAGLHMGKYFYFKHIICLVLSEKLVN